MIAGRFDQEKVQTQLRYTGVLETTRIRQQVGPLLIFVLMLFLLCDSRFYI